MRVRMHTRMDAQVAKYGAVNVEVLVIARKCINVNGVVLSDLWVES